MAKMQFHIKNLFIYFDFTSFFCLDFREISVSKQLVLDRFNILPFPYSEHADWMNYNCQRTCKRCPVDCQWTPWTKQGSCSRSCGDGTQVFTRTKLAESENGGKNCLGGDR